MAQLLQACRSDASQFNNSIFIYHWFLFLTCKSSPVFYTVHYCMVLSFVTVLSKKWLQNRTNLYLFTMKHLLLPYTVGPKLFFRVISLPTFTLLILVIMDHLHMPCANKAIWIWEWIILHYLHMLYISLSIEKKMLLQISHLDAWQ